MLSLQFQYTSDHVVANPTSVYTNMHILIHNDARNQQGRNVHTYHAITILLHAQASYPMIQIYMHD